MDNQEIEQSLRDYPKQISNNSYLELLEKYFLSDKTNDLENKHKEWCNQLLNKKQRLKKLAITSLSLVAGGRFELPTFGL